MSQHRQTSGISWGLGVSVLVAVIAWSAAAAPAFAGTVAPGAARVAASPGAVTLASPVVAGVTDFFSGLIDGMTGNRARVIQFATVIMILALWVIWWRK